MSKPLSYLREQFPDVEPRIIISDFSQQLRMLKEDHLDILLGTRDMITNQEDFRFTLLYNCRSCVVFSDNYRNDLLSDEVSLADLETCPLIALHSKSFPVQPDDAIEKFLTAKARSMHIVRQEDVAAVITLVSSGYGVGILPEYVLAESVKASIYYARIKESPRIEYGIIRGATAKNPYITRFSDILAAHILGGANID